MTTSAIATLEKPLDGMYLIHKALREQAFTVESIARDLCTNGSLQQFNLAFNSWASALMFHSEQEDEHVHPPDPNSSTGANPAGEQLGSLMVAIIALEEQSHVDMLKCVEDVFGVLYEDIGRTSIIPRTQQHLFREIVALRIAQEDHLDTEEALVLPILRESTTDDWQVDAMRHLLVDDQADDQRWVMDWVLSHLDSHEKTLMAGLESRF